MQKYYELNNRDEYGCFGYSQEDVAETFYYKDFRIQFFKSNNNNKGGRVSISAHPKNSKIYKKLQRHRLRLCKCRT